MLLLTRRPLVLVTALGVLTALGAAACAKGAKTPSAAPGQAAGGAVSQVATTVVATVGGTPITLGQVDDHALEQPASDFGGLRLSEAVYQARQNALEGIVGNQLLDEAAKAQGVDRAAIVTKEITSKVTPPTDADIAAWYQANQARVQGATLDQVHDPIKALLVQQRTIEERARYLATLKVMTPVVLSLEAPREKVAAEGRPSRGPAGAPIEMIEFSDFQCPFCLRAYPTVKDVLKTYGDKVRLVYRNYPLPNHPNARPAAEAAACAAAQGKFWEFHDHLFEHQNELAAEDLKKDAVALGLDAKTFDTCFDGTEHAKEIDADIAAGAAIGISGTPAFFINGRPLEGAQPVEEFKRVIDEELARAH